MARQRVSPPLTCHAAPKARTVFIAHHLGDATRFQRWTKSGQFRAAHPQPGERKPLTLSHPDKHRPDLRARGQRRQSSLSMTGRCFGRQGRGFRPCRFLPEDEHLLRGIIARHRWPRFETLHPARRARPWRKVLMDRVAQTTYSEEDNPRTYFLPGAGAGVAGAGLPAAGLSALGGSGGSVRSIFAVLRKSATSAVCAFCTT
jgi:hypothetical protein